MAKNPNFTQNLVIIGTSCRLPGPASSLEALHRLLKDKTDAITTVPPERFAQDRFVSKANNFPGHSYTNAAGIVPSMLEFDPEFFGIARTEAEDMDPQQRLILEMTWEAMEDAGIPPSSLRGSDTGVYMGAAGTDTALRNTDDIVAGTPYTMTGSTLSIVSNRVSYLFDLHGPSLSIDTACSSSLVALHLACEALRNGEMPLAVVGGINCLLAPYPFAGFSKARMLSPDGRCKVFDAKGNGYVRSEGGGVILVATEEYARKHGYKILAFIAGSGVNSDGRTTGIALPNPEAQATLIRNVYTRFHLDPRKLVYVEAHGTGTAVGDPLEAQSIGQELGRGLAGLRPLPVGSVKSNIGHLETASGMAGLLKALLVLRHGEVFPNLHFTEPNPAIDFAGENILVPTENIPLADVGEGALVSVNSFGFGGTNAHIVLRQAPSRKNLKPRKTETTEATPLPPLLLSARSGQSLRNLAGEYAAMLHETDEASYRTLAQGLALQRDQMDLRAPAAGESVVEIREALQAIAASEKTGNVRAIREDIPLRHGSGVFAFSGNGSQWPGMGKELLAKDKSFRDVVSKIDAILAPMQNWSILSVLRDPEKHPDAFVQTEHSQPLIFAIQVGIVEALKARGILPAAVIGHSVGEVAAAWCAGAISLADACLVIHVRSVLQAPLNGTGSMAAANMSEEKAREILLPYGDKVEIAAVNTRSSLSLAGDTESLKAVVAECKKRRIAAKMLAIPYPFHTHYMDAIQENLGEALKRIKPRKPEIPFFSTVLGAYAKSVVFDAAYWRCNVRQSVLFAPALEAAWEKGYRLFMEVGPSPVLRSYIRDALRDKPGSTFVAASLNKNGDEKADLDNAWKSAWQHGWKLDTGTLFQGDQPQAALPTYPWNREYCRRGSSPECRGYVDAPRVHPLLGWQMPLQTPVFENTIHLADFPWLADHVAGSQTLFPAAAFLESMLAASRFLYPEQSMALERASLLRPLAFPPDAAKSLRIAVDKEDGGLVFEARSYNSDEAWSTCAKARLVPAAGEAAFCSFTPSSPKSFGIEVGADRIYELAERSHLHYGESFRAVRSAWLKSGISKPEVLAELVMPGQEEARGMHLPPTLLDGAFHTLFLLLEAKNDSMGRAYLPAAFERVVLLAEGLPRFAHARLEKVGPRSVVASFALFDRDGKLLALLRNCRFRRALSLEQENLPSRPYVQSYLPIPHPAATALPAALTISHLRKMAHNSLKKNISYRDKQAVQPWSLLQFAALAAAHETLFSLQRHAEIDFSCEDFLGTGSLSPAQEYWTRHLLERLERVSLSAASNGGRWKLMPRDKRKNATVLWRTAIATSPEHVSEAALLSHVFASRDAILRGEYDERETDLIPESLRQNYFENSASLRPYAVAAQRALRAMLHETAAGEELRILHFGQDVDAFISNLAPELRKASCRYVVAVRDKATADAGNERYSHLPAVHFIAQDMDEADPEREGYYHLLALSWTLHQSASVSQSLAECRKMLAPGGVLLVLEQSPSLFADYVFGACPSWWRASPDKDNPVSLLQSATFWKKEMAEAGFGGIALEEPPQAPAFLLFGRKEGEVELQPKAEQTTRPEGQQEIAAEAPPARNWLVAGARKGTVAEKLAVKLAGYFSEQGEKVRLLPEPGSAATDLFDLRDSAAWHQAIAGAGQHNLQLVYLGGYDTGEDLSPSALESLQLDALAGLTALAGALEESDAGIRLWLITGGAAAGDFAGARPVPSQGVSLGFSRVMANELRKLTQVCIDIHATDPLPLVPALAREMLLPSGEDELVLTGEGRFVPRLEEYRPQEDGANAEEQPLGAMLTFDQPGRLRNLYWKQCGIPSPAPDQVRVKVNVAGLNFRDVMWSMGLLPDEALENGFSGPGIGIECSGVIDAVGDAVTGWAVGDEVVCFGPSCFSTHILTLASAVTAKPQNISFSDAATIPVAFMTAWYSLRHLAQMRPGERLLIHGAAGGVGIAALQIASHLGLEVYATAGASEKHHFLHRFGVKNLFSSRSLDFASQIMAATKGEGVDCVLNSLSGEAASASIGLLRPFGRFIELGKRDFFADSPMRLRPFSNNLSYFGVDVDQLIIHQPDLAQDLFTELMELFARRKLVPLPHSVYSANRAVEAFRAMQQASHIGKLVVSLDGAAKIAKKESRLTGHFSPKANGTYLVSGGSSGLGFATACMLAERGARHLLLLSRRGVSGEAERTKLEALRKQGLTVRELLVDVADPLALKLGLEKECAQLPPLRGVVHAAAVLDDGMINSLNTERLQLSLAAKSLGAWNLHQATLGTSLDFFCLFSSATTLFGNPGQAGYVAGNAMLESLAAYRRKCGLPAQVIGWGPIGDTGMLTRNPKARQLLLQKMGIHATSSAEAARWLEECISMDIPFSTYFGLDWRGRSELPVFASPRFSLLRQGRGESSNASASVLDAVRTADAKEGLRIVTEALLGEIAQILHIPADKLGADEPLAAQGMDSLMAVELALGVEQLFELSGYSLPLTEKTTTLSLAQSIYTKITSASGGEEAPLQEGMVDQIIQKHGLHLSESDRQDTLKTLTGVGK